jgi:protein translocase SecG subunit
MQSSKSSGLGGAFGGDTQSFTPRGKAASKEAKLQKWTQILAVGIGVIAVAMMILG